MISFEQALSTVREKIEAAGYAPKVERIALSAARGRVLAEELIADRDYPPFDRSTRDGFAVCAADLLQAPVTLEVKGLARAGEPYTGRISKGGAVEIMTGAPLPPDTDAVVMMEHTREPGRLVVSSDVKRGTRWSGNSESTRRVEVLRPAAAGDNVVAQGSEAKAGSVVLPRGRRMGPGEIGLAASIGHSEVQVFVRPGVAILPTGDEVVPVDGTPEWHQIRNSNALALAALVEAAGGVPHLLGIAPDDKGALRALIEEGLRHDLLVLTGGISVGKYDYVAEVLAGLGAEIFFQGVGIRPGKPLTFGRVRERFFFALPGNPVSTFVTFEVFARPAVTMLGGADFEASVFLKARLGKAVHQKAGLTVFMPARVAPACAHSEFAAPTGAEAASDPVVELVGWQGSGDLVGLAQANCFLVAFPGQTELAAGEWVDVLLRSW